MIKKFTKREKGITLIALVITIIVLLILAGVSISMLTGDNGILTQAKVAKISTALSNYKEELEIYKSSKKAEDANFLDSSLTAGKNTLSYNTQKEDERNGNIKSVITQIDEEYMEKLEIIKGGLLINTKDKEEIKIAKRFGIEVNPYDIIDGELISSNGNLLLMDESGTVTIPDSVTKIGEGAFANVSGLKTIIIPETVKEISNNAFAYNQTLEKVIIKSGLERIGTKAFLECDKLKEINLPDTLNYIGEMAFFHCRELRSIDVPRKVENIFPWTFAGDSNIEKIILNEGLKTIQSNAFFGTNFTDIVIPSTVKNIEKEVFSKNIKLKNIIIQDGAEFVYENGMLMNKNKENLLFISDSYLNNIKTFVIPEGIKNFDTSLEYYKNITKIVIPATLENITNATIFPNTIEEIEVSPHNKKLSVSKEDKILYTKDKKEIIVCYSKEENINIDPDNNIGFLVLNDWSFILATNAKRIILPDSLITIKKEVFEKNDKLEEIKIGNNVSNINPLFKYKNYKGIVTIDPSNNYYKIEDNILYNKENDRLIVVLNEINGEFNISSKVREIGDYAFHGQNKMTSVNIPSMVTTIGRAFNYCEFKTIDIPENIQTIDNGCFGLNPNLEKIKIHKKQNSIPGAPWGAVKGMKVVEWK